jgi:ribosome-binding protein aMBF1 (putative translation factor)
MAYEPMNDTEKETQTYGEVRYNLIEAARNAGLSINDLADKAHMNRAVLRDASMGLKWPSPQQLARICVVLNVEPGALFVHIKPEAK